MTKLLDAQSFRSAPTPAHKRWHLTGNVSLSPDLLGFLQVKIEEQRYVRDFWHTNWRHQWRLETRWRLARFSDLPTLGVLNGK